MCHHVSIPVLRVPPPVGHVDLRRPRDDQLELSGVEGGQQSGIDDLVEAAGEGVGLGGDAALQSPFHHAFDVVLENFIDGTVRPQRIRLTHNTKCKK